MSETVKNRFAVILRTEREKRGWTLEQMAEYLGTKKQVLSRYERGERNPKLITAALFAQKLGIPMQEFEQDIEVPMRLISSMELSKEEQERVRLLKLIEKHSVAIELLDSLPDSDYKRAVEVLRILSDQSDKQ